MSPHYPYLPFVTIPYYFDYPIKETFIYIHCNSHPFFLTTEVGIFSYYTDTRECHRNSLATYYNHQHTVFKRNLSYVYSALVSCSSLHHIEQNMQISTILCKLLYRQIIINITNPSSHKNQSESRGFIYVAGHPLLNRRCTILPGCFYFPKRKL